VIRGAGTHAAGVVIADKPMIEYVPLHRPTGANAEDTPIKVLTQFEMSTIESLGLLKVDFLGLSTLTIMQRACDLIRERHGVALDLYNIPLDDAATYELLGRGETAGVFQFEGAGMRRWMMAMKPHALENAVAMVALFRPGPMDFIPTYIARMHGEEPVSYAHPKLESIFAETFGIPVYQEQLMFAVMQVAGYSAAEADDLRKAIAKKIETKLKKHRKKFIDGAVQQGIEEKKAGDIFSDWENFARYGFNKAHAADYGLIAVQTAYLKVHYPVEYMTALLSVSQGDTDKVAFYISDCRRMGMQVLAPDINTSVWDFAVEDREAAEPAIRFGLGAVKNVGKGAIDAIIAGRSQRPFENLADFANRVDLRQVGKRPLECLVKAGALDAFGDRHSLLSVVDQVVATSSAHFAAAEAGQITMFAAGSGLEPTITLAPAASGDIEFLRRERLNWERELIGLYVSDHPLSKMMDELSQVVTHFSSELGVAAPEERVRVAGMVKNFRSFQTKRGKDMAFVTIEDPQGIIDLVVFPETWKRFQSLVQLDKLIIAEGKLDAQDAESKVLVDKIDTKQSIVIAQPDQSSAPPLAAIEPAAPAKAEPVPEFTPPPDLSPAFSSSVPEPETFPDDWWQIQAEDHAPIGVAIPLAPDELTIEMPLGEAVMAAPEPETEEADVVLDPADEIAISGAATSMANSAVQDLGAGLSAVVTDSPKDPGPIPFAAPPQKARPERPVRMGTIYMRSLGDKARDILHMRRVHGAIISYPGNDRFNFYVFEGRSAYLLEFPNDTTDLSDELIARLEEMLGPNNVRIEDVTFQ
jgi:DNA polymerase-3 subunit alpha